MADRRLETVAGEPLAVLTEPGSSAGRFDIGEGAPRIGYAVASIKPGDRFERPIAAMGTSNPTAIAVNGGSVLRTDRGNGVMHRSQPTGGTIAFRTDSNPWWKADTTYVWAFWWDGRLSCIERLGGPALTSTHAEGDSMAGNMLVSLSADDPGVSPIAAAFYAANHSPAQRLAVMRWLAARHGAVTA